MAFQDLEEDILGLFAEFEHDPEWVWASWSGYIRKNENRKLYEVVRVLEPRDCFASYGDWRKAYLAKPEVKKSRSIQGKLYVAKHKESIAEYKKAWAAKNKEKMKSNYNSWYAKNKEKVNARRRFLAAEKKNALSADSKKRKTSGLENS